MIHEFGHIALLSKDRPYYRPTSKLYAELTPRGSWASQLPGIGPVIREVVASDTLYHPDAYAHFALEMYLNHGIQDISEGYDGQLQEDETDIQAIDSWALAQ